MQLPPMTSPLMQLRSHTYTPSISGHFDPCAFTKLDASATTLKHRSTNPAVRQRMAIECRGLGIAVTPESKSDLNSYFCLLCATRARPMDDSRTTHTIATWI